MPVAAAELLEDEIAVAITDDSMPVIVAETAEEVAANELVTALMGPEAPKLCPE